MLHITLQCTNKSCMESFELETDDDDAGEANCPECNVVIKFKIAKKTSNKND